MPTVTPSVRRTSNGWLTQWQTWPSAKRKKDAPPGISSTGRVFSTLVRGALYPRAEAMKPSFTIGIEEEYQTIDPETRDLRSHLQMEIIGRGKTLLREQIKPEMHQSVIEVGTGVCANIQEARKDIVGLRCSMLKLAREAGLK